MADHPVPYPLRARPLRADHVTETAIADEVVLFDASCYQAFTLNPPATAVWMRCNGTRCVADIVAELQDAFDASPDELKRDVVAVVERLRGQNLIALDERDRESVS